MAARNFSVIDEGESLFPQAKSKTTSASTEMKRDDFCISISMRVD